MNKIAEAKVLIDFPSEPNDRQKAIETLKKLIAETNQESEFRNQIDFYITKIDASDPKFSDCLTLQTTALYTTYCNDHLLKIVKKLKKYLDGEGYMNSDLQVIFNCSNYIAYSINA